MEELYCNAKAKLRSTSDKYRIEWKSEKSFVVNYKENEFLFDESNRDLSILGIEASKGPSSFARRRNILTCHFNRYMNLQITKYPYSNNGSSRPEYENKQLDFKKEIYVSGIVCNPVSAPTIKGYKDVMVYFPYTGLRQSEQSEFDNAVPTHSDVFEKFKHEYEFDRRGDFGAVFEPAQFLESHLQAKYMLREFEDNDLYTSYFMYHKPDEYIALDNARITVLENAATFTLRSMNALSRKCSGVDFIHNKIIQAIGFEVYGQSCSCPIEKWNRFKEFMKSSTPHTSDISHAGLYMLQLNCDKGTNKYKIGKATNLLARLKSTEYRNAFIVCSCCSSHIDECERELITVFTERWRNVRESEEGGFGNEMFEGERGPMIQTFYEICMKYLQ